MNWTFVSALLFAFAPTSAGMQVSLTAKKLPLLTAVLAPTVWRGNWGTMPNALLLRERAFTPTPRLLHSVHRPCRRNRAAGGGRSRAGAIPGPSDHRSA